MSRTTHAVVIATMALALAACRGEPPETAPLPGPGPTATAAGEVAGPPTGVADGLAYSPQPLPTCLGGQVAEIRWNLKSAAGSTTVNIKLVEPDGSERVFAQSGMSGSKATGPWARPGLVFIARDTANDEELARVTLDGTGC